jgi:hypothetical protein
MCLSRVSSCRVHCTIAHFWAHHPNANRGSKGNGSKFIRNKNDNGSGIPRNIILEKEVERLKRAAVNRDIELVKANARHKAFKRATTTVSYSQMMTPTPVAPAPAPAPAPYHQQDPFPPLRSRQQFVSPAAAAPVPPDLVSMLARMDAQLTAQAAQMEMLMSLSRTA